MADPGLSPLQKRILEVLASLEPPWTLTGGGALALCYQGDRITRDLDLFFLGQRNLGDMVHAASDRRRGEGGGGAKVISPDRRQAGARDPLRRL